MQKALLILLLFSVTLSLETLDPIYVGVFEDDQWYDMIVLYPEELEYELELDLTEGQEAYYFYNLGFGKYG